jgi:2-C-methyl-D-erythritol 4-phosphate cytidylyltransferase
MSVACVVVAGGSGSRFGGLKQFAQLGGDTVTGHSIRAARSVASLVVLVAPQGHTDETQGADVVVAGGVTRAGSVRAGINACGDAEIIVVHDAARPLASPALFAAVVGAIRDGAEACIPGLGITDTVKRIAQSNGEVIVSETIARDELVTVQTPQAFRAETLKRAHASKSDATDDAGLVEALGTRVVVVLGEPSNIKITHPGDIEQAERIAGSVV